jgi:asparagine synthase (glutamine-hydrolysing)
MCGLTGFWESPGKSAKDLMAIAARMAETLRHRGPDDNGEWSDAESGVALGFRRLSILDLSPAAHQPMLSADGRYAIVFNGEIYNHRELREKLMREGAVFRSTSDTEVLVELASKYGPVAVFSRIWGMFAIAIWDRREKTLYLARDRFGKKPLYYARCGELFLFGSELKSLRTHPGFRRDIDRDAVAAYLRFGYVPAPHCIYRCASKLLPGHFAVVRQDKVPETRPFWDARTVIPAILRERKPMAEPDAVSDLEALLTDAVSRRLISDVPLGALLSGGIDSSLVVALMQACSPKPVRTFTIGSPDAVYDEAKAAKAVAAHLRTDHTELYVTPDEGREVIPKIPDLYDEPFSDSSQIPTYLVSRIARQHVTVALSGDGGDEVFGGYTRYMLAEGLWRWMRATPAAVRRIASRTIQKIPVGTIDRIYRGLEPLVPDRWRLGLAGDKAHKVAEMLETPDQDMLYRRLVSAWKNPGLLMLRGREPAGLLDDPLLRDLFPVYTERMMFLDLMTYLPDDILVKVDRASMAVGLEVRSPLLDHRLVEWAWRLPMNFRVREGKSKWLLRQVLYRHVPRELVERPKMGFGIPLGSWLRGPLAEWAESLLAEKRLKEEGFFRSEPIRQAWSEHLSGNRAHEYRLWCILMFQAWLEREK